MFVSVRRNDGTVPEEIIGSVATSDMEKSREVDARSVTGVTWLQETIASRQTVSKRVMPPNDPNSATAATRRADCNRDGPPPFAAAHGHILIRVAGLSLRRCQRRAGNA